jgi:hypothetical protein
VYTKVPQKVHTTATRRCTGKKDEWSGLKDLARKANDFVLIENKEKQTRTENVTSEKPGILPCEEWEIPPGWFKNELDGDLPVVKLDRMIENETGIALADANTALLYSSRTSLLSEHALAFLVPVGEIPTGIFRKSIMNVALRHVVTKQFATFTCTLLQLGKQEAARNAKVHACPDVEANLQLDFSLNKEDFNEEWQAVRAGPIKFLFTKFPTLQEAMLVLRDRKEYRNGQNITLKIQIRAKARDGILHMSGMNGVQVLPRGESGEVDAGFRVVWLKGVTHEQASVRAKQTDATYGVVQRPGHPPSIGIRVTADGYHQMRPVLTLSEDTTEHIASILKFRIEPTPIGADRETIAALIAPLGWRCRPLVPVPGSLDSWVVGAEVDPPEWVLTFTGGDISITPWLRQGKGKGKGSPKPTINLDLSSYGSKASWGSYTNGGSPTPGVPFTQLAQAPLLLKQERYPDVVDVQQSGRIAELERQLVYVASRLDGAEKIQAKNNDVIQAKIEDAASTSASNLAAMESRMESSLAASSSSQMTEFRQMLMMQTTMIKNLVGTKHTEEDAPAATDTTGGAATDMSGGAVRMVRPRLDVKPEKMELDHHVADGSEEPVDGEF